MAGIGEKRRVRYPKVMFIEPQDLPQTTKVSLWVSKAFYLHLFRSEQAEQSEKMNENDRIHLTHCEYAPILFSKNWHVASPLEISQ